MIQQQVHIINTILMMLDAACIILASYGAYYITSYHSGGTWSVDKLNFTIIVFSVIILNNYVMGILHLYGEKRPESFAKLAAKIIKSVIIVFVILFACIYLIEETGISRNFLLIFSGLCILLLMIQRVYSQFYILRQSKKDFNIQKILIVGDLVRSSYVKNLLENQLSWGHQVLNILPLNNESYRANDSNERNADVQLQKFLRENEVDEVIFAFQADRAIKLNLLLDICIRMGIRTKILPALFDPKGKKLSTEWFQGVPFLTLQSDNFNASGLFYKRLLDIIGGLVGTIVFLLLYPFVAMCIKVDSPGPVIFKQKRVGQHGRKFFLYKFRSMHKDAESKLSELAGKNQMNGHMFKLHNDPRVTRVGKWLRITSIDEFPQFINVLKGEMSLVGTRPPTPHEVEKYDLWHLKRIAAKPGITGMWQISGRNRINDFEKVVELDCHYLENWKFIDDIKILFKTVWVVLKRKGAI